MTRDVAPHAARKHRPAPDERMHSQTLEMRIFTRRRELLRPCGRGKAVVVEAVTPQIDGTRHPVKRVADDTLKVGHHGSAYSPTPEFVRAVAPRVAVMFVGRDNLFGHPAPSTIETLGQSARASTAPTELARSRSSSMEPPFSAF